MNRNYTLGDLAQRNDTLCSYKTRTWVFTAALFIIAPNWK